MFLFPWLHHGKSISNFEKSTFFHGDAIFTPLGRVKRPKICINKVCIGGCKNRKSYEKFKKMLESCQETSKLSVDSFMASWDRVVLQKSDFWKKIFEKVANTLQTPPGYLIAWYHFLTSQGCEVMFSMQLTVEICTFESNFVSKWLFQK